MRSSSKDLPRAMTSQNGAPQAKRVSDSASADTEFVQAVRLLRTQEESDGYSRGQVHEIGRDWPFLSNDRRQEAQFPKWQGEPQCVAGRSRPHMVCARRAVFEIHDRNHGTTVGRL